MQNNNQPDVSLSPQSLSPPEPSIVKRRCLNTHMNVQVHQRIQEHVARQALRLNPEEMVYIPIIFHFLTTKKTLARQDYQHYMFSILNVLNRDYGRVGVDVSSIDWSKYPLLQTPENKQTFINHVSCAASPNIQFVNVREPKVYHFSGFNQGKGDLKYWDQIIKKQTAPPIDPATCAQMWVCIDARLPFLGYAEFPEVVYTPEKLAIDGVVYNISAAPYDKHKTPVHEFGHWLGLNHTFHQEANGNYDDGVLDTPYQTLATSGNPIFNTRWPSSVLVDPVSQKPTESKHMFINNMDYTDDAGMLCFTRNQVDIMRRNVQTVRKNWILDSKQAFQLYNSLRQLQSPGEGNIIFQSLPLPTPVSPIDPTRHQEQQQQQQPTQYLISPIDYSNPSSPLTQAKSESYPSLIKWSSQGFRSRESSGDVAHSPLGWLSFPQLILKSIQIGSQMLDCCIPCCVENFP